MFTPSWRWRSSALDVPGRGDLTRAELHAATMEGAVERVRPMMTVIAIVAGLLPILRNEGTGSEVMRRIAEPMIGGMASSTLLTRLVIPEIYALKGCHLAPLSAGSYATVRTGSAAAQAAAGGGRR